jgi:phytoene desaturase
MGRAIVVGAGLGGLSTAVRLAAHGWDVSMYDKNDQPGGRMSTISVDGYVWDVGPTLIMMPEVLRDLFEAAGRRLEDYVDLRRMNPSYRVVFEEDGHLDLTGDLPAMLENVEAIEPGAGPRFLRFLAEAERLARETRASIIERVFNGKGDLVRPAVLAALLRARPFATVASAVAAHFRTPALRQAFSFQTLYLGTSPRRTPAAYLMIPFVEVALGVWYPMGGPHRIARAMARLAGELGVRIRLGTPVSRILTEHRRAVGVRLEDGTTERADVVVANAEWGYTQAHLLPDGRAVPAHRYGCSGVLLLLAVRGPIQGPHHTFVLSGDFDGNLADIFERRCLPERPSVYVSRPTATDPTLAPAGVELLYVLVPCPTLESPIDWRGELPGFRKRVLDRLSRIGIENLDGRILAEHVLTPGDFGARYNLTQGSAFGLAATLFQSGPFRPTIRSPRYRGLYHVGASSHPGGGVPIVTLSGRMAAQAVLADSGQPVSGRVAAGLAAGEAWSGSS